MLSERLLKLFGSTKCHFPSLSLLLVERLRDTWFVCQECNTTRGRSCLQGRRTGCIFHTVWTCMDKCFPAAPNAGFLVATSAAPGRRSECGTLTAKRARTRITLWRRTTLNNTGDGGRGWERNGQSWNSGQSWLKRLGLCTRERAILEGRVCNLGLGTSA